MVVDDKGLSPAHSWQQQGYRRELPTIGGIAALACALLYLIAAGVNVAAMRLGPPPETALQWLSLLQSNPINALFRLGADSTAMAILWGPIVLALYSTLKRHHPTASLIAAVLALLGMAIHLATEPACLLLSLSRQYAAATTQAERSVILAAGEGMLAIQRGAAARYAGMPSVWLAAVIFSVVMLRSQALSRDTAWAGILGMGLLLASIPVARYAPTWPPTLFVSGVVAFTYLGGGVLSWAWYLAVGWSLLKLGRSWGRTTP